MNTVTLRPGEILAAFADEMPGVYFGLSAEIQARIFTALAGFLVEHPELPPLWGPACTVRHPEIESEPESPYAEAQVSRAEAPAAVAVAVWAAAAGVEMTAQLRGNDARVSAEIPLTDGVRLIVWGVERVALRPSPRQALDDLLRARLGTAAGGDPAGGAQ
jgi:hypothetical protein